MRVARERFSSGDISIAYMKPREIEKETPTYIYFTDGARIEKKGTAYQDGRYLVIHQDGISMAYRTI